MRLVFAGLAMAALPVQLPAQAAGRWPPDSLRNVQVIPRTTPVSQVIGVMRNITFDLGVRCQFCHVGEEGMPLERFDFTSDDKRTKRVARQMMRMVEEINRRVDTLPERSAPAVQVTCRTCHHGISRPAPLSTLMVEIAQTSGADSALRAYRALRERYYGSDSYDFREPTLNIAAFRLGRADRVADALVLLDFNEQLFPNSSAMAVFRGNIQLMRGDTAAAEEAFREAIRRDSTNAEARGRLRQIGRPPQNSTDPPRACEPSLPGPGSRVAGLPQNHGSASPGQQPLRQGGVTQGEIRGRAHHRQNIGNDDGPPGQQRPHRGRQEPDGKDGHHESGRHHQKDPGCLRRPSLRLGDEPGDNQPDPQGQRQMQCSVEQHGSDIVRDRQLDDGRVANSAKQRLAQEVDRVEGTSCRQRVEPGVEPRHR